MEPEQHEGRHGPDVLRRPARTAIRPADPARRPRGEARSSAPPPVHRRPTNGLAPEELAGFLALAGTPITDPERGAMLVLAQRMQVDDNVPRALAFCPAPDSPSRRAP